MSLSWGNLVSRGDGPTVERFLWNADIANDIFEYEPILLKSALFGCMEKFINFPNIVIKALEHLQDCHLLSPPGIANEELTVSYDAFLMILTKWMNKHDVVLASFQLLSMLADRPVMKKKCVLVDQGQLLFLVNDAIAIHHQSRHLQRAALQLYESILENADTSSLEQVSTAIFMPVLDNLSINFEDIAICYSSLSILAQLVDYNANLMSPWQDQIISITLVTVGKKLTAEVTSKCLILIGKLRESSFLYSRVSRHKRGLFLFIDAISILTPSNISAAIIALEILLKVLEDEKLTTLIIRSSVRQQPFDLTSDLLTDLTNKYERYLSLLSEEEERGMKQDENLIQSYIFLFTRIEEILNDLIHETAPPGTFPPPEPTIIVPEISNVAKNIESDKNIVEINEVEPAINEVVLHESLRPDSHASEEPKQEIDEKQLNDIVGPSSKQRITVEKFSDSEEESESGSDDEKSHRDGSSSPGASSDNEDIVQNAAEKYSPMIRDNMEKDSDDEVEDASDNPVLARILAALANGPQRLETRQVEPQPPASSPIRSSDEWPRAASSDHVDIVEEKEEEHEDDVEKAQQYDLSSEGDNSDLSEPFEMNQPFNDDVPSSEESVKQELHSSQDTKIDIVELPTEDTCPEEDNMEEDVDAVLLHPSIESTEDELEGRQLANNANGSELDEQLAVDLHSFEEDSDEIDAQDNVISHEGACPDSEDLLPIVKNYPVEVIMQRQDDNKEEGEEVEKQEVIEEQEEEQKEELKPEELIEIPQNDVSLGEMAANFNNKLSLSPRSIESIEVGENYGEVMSSDLEDNSLDEGFRDISEPMKPYEIHEENLLDSETQLTSYDHKHTVPEQIKSVATCVDSKESESDEDAAVNEKSPTEVIIDQTQHVQDSNPDSVSSLNTQNNSPISPIPVKTTPVRRRTTATPTPLANNPISSGKRRNTVSQSPNHPTNTARSNSIFNILKANRQIFHKQEKFPKNHISDTDEKELSIDLANCSSDSSEDDAPAKPISRNVTTAASKVQNIPVESPVKHAASKDSTVDFKFDEVYPPDAMELFSDFAMLSPTTAAALGIPVPDSTVKVNPQYIEQLHTALEAAEEETRKAKEKTLLIQTLFTKATNKVEALLKENGKLSEKLHTMAEERETSEVHSKQNKTGKPIEDKIRKNEIPSNSSQQAYDEAIEAKRVSTDCSSVNTMPSTIATDEDGEGSFFTSNSNKQKSNQPASALQKKDTKAVVISVEKSATNRVSQSKDSNKTPHVAISDIDATSSGSKAKTAKAVDKTMKLKASFEQQQQQMTPAKSSTNLTVSKEEQDIQLIVTATLEAIDYCQGQELFPMLHEGLPSKGRSSPLLTQEEIAVNIPLPPYNALSKDLQSHLLSVLHKFAKTLSHFFAILVDLNVNPNPQTRQSTVHHHSSMQPIISIHLLQSFLIKIKLIDNSLVTLQDAYLVFNKFRAKHLTLFGTTFSMILLGQKYFSSPAFGVINYILFLEKMDNFLHESLVHYRKQQVTQVDETIEVEPILTTREFHDIIKLLQKEIKPLMVLYESYLPYVSNKQLENAAASILMQANAKRSAVPSSTQRKDSSNTRSMSEADVEIQRLQYEQHIVFSLSANCATPLDATQGITPHTAAAVASRKHQLSPTPMRITALQATSTTPEVGEGFPMNAEEDGPPDHHMHTITDREQHERYSIHDSHQPLSSSMKPALHRIHLSPHAAKFQLPNNVFHYYLPSSTTTATPIPKVLTFSEILQFAKEFQIIPSMYSRQQLYEIYRTTIPRNDVALQEAEEDFLFSNSITLDFPMFLDCLVIMALRCPLFRAIPSPITKVHNFFMLLNLSSGKNLLAKRNRNKELVVFKPVLPSSLHTSRDDQPEEFLRKSTSPLRGINAVGNAMYSTTPTTSNNHSRSPSPPTRNAKSLSYYDPQTQSLTHSKRKKTIQEMRSLMTNQ